MTVQKQLYLAFASITAIGIVTVVIALLSTHRLSAAIADLSGRSEDATYYAGQIDTITSDLQAEQRGMLLRRMMKQDALSDKLIEDHVASMASLRRFVTLYEGLKSGPEVRAKLRSLSDHLAVAERLNPELLQRVRQGDLEGAGKYLDEGLSAAVDLASAEGAELLDLQQKYAHEDGAMHAVESNRVVWLIWLMFVPLVIAITILLRVIGRMTWKLRRAIFEFGDAANEISTSAQEVAASSIMFAEGVEQQAAAVEETSAASVAIATLAQQSSESSRVAVSIVHRSQEASRQTNDSLGEMVHAMEGITASSRKISKINKVIDEIAFQTNILALNAAVEAARAGEAGQGFAVVADEVRSLAQRCSQAAKDTSSLIEESVQRSEGGRTKVNQVAAATIEAANESAKIKGLIEEINLASQEQSTGIQKISRAIQQMESFSQSGASGATQGAAAAKQLAGHAQGLRDSISRLQEMVERRRGPGAPPIGPGGVVMERRRASGKGIKNLPHPHATPVRA